MPNDAAGGAEPTASAAARPRAGGGDFHLRVAAVWAILAVVLAGGLWSLGLDFGLIAEKLPFLLGLRLSPNGFVQGVVLTLLVTALSMVAALVVGVLTALGRLSRRAIPFALATFYASFFRGTPLLVQVLLIYLALPQFGIVLSGLTSGSSRCR